MENKDKELLTWYMCGFHDELFGSTSSESIIPLQNRAYNLGSLHAIVGDDVQSVDYLTEEEILKLIKE